MNDPSERLPRGLTTREREVLAHLLSVVDPRVEPLRAQSRAVAVSGECDCGCATIDLAVDHDGHEPAGGLARNPAVEARTRIAVGDDPDRGYELLLFLDAGWLSSLEIVYYGDTVPTEFPPPAELEAPFLSPA